jgi:hypothetical protein
MLWQGPEWAAAQARVPDQISDGKPHRSDLRGGKAEESELVAVTHRLKHASRRRNPASSEQHIVTCLGQCDVMRLLAPAGAR